MALSWPIPPAGLSLPEDEVHVWQVSLEQPDVTVQRLVQTLSDDEWSKAQRFYFERDRRRYVIGRGVLRAILGRYLGLAPETIRFTYGDRGKPALAIDLNGDFLHFNLSHSGEMALYAFARGQELGVDIEVIRPLDDAEPIARRFFSAREVADFLSVPVDQRPPAFFNCWTRKEAYIKAVGVGLAHPLDKFVVSLIPGQPAALLHEDDEPDAPGRWSIQSLDPGPGYVGALAIAKRDYQSRLWQWTVDS
ncbi:MAG: 4'-phosphopantetheinyl transferase superfamily protein [Chloroflexota bacterium]